MHKWDIPPRSLDELFIWKIYCRIHKDVGLPAPGTWIHQWIRQEKHIAPTGESVEWNEFCYAMEAVRWYVYQCKE